MSRNPLLPRVFLHQASQTPDAVAVRHRFELTYRHLRSESGALAGRLRALGVAPGSVVGISLSDGAQLPTALLGVWQAGAAFLLLEPDAPEGALERDVRAGGIRFVITDERSAERAGAVRTVCLDRPADAVDFADVPFEVEPGSPAFVARRADGSLLTVDHASAARFVGGALERYAITADDRILMADPGVGGRLPWEVLAALSVGASLLTGDTTVPPHAGTATVVPLDARLAGLRTPADFYSARLMVAAEQLSCEQLQEWTGGDPGLPLWRTYGQESCGVDVAAALFDPERKTGLYPAEPDLVQVLDEYGDPVPPGVPGELYVGGFGAAAGFPGRPDLTAARLIPDVDGEPGSRLLRTGRVVRLRHDGALEDIGSLAEQNSDEGLLLALASVERPEHVAPRTPEEEAVAQVWAGLLARDDIGVLDNFFQLGGHSLLLHELIDRLKERTGRELSIAQVYAALTLEDQARLIAAERADAGVIPAVPRDEPLPLSSEQRRLWLLDTLNPDSPEWVIPLFLRLSPDTTTETVRTALDLLAARHESLRTRYVSVDGVPMQLIEPSAVIGWSELAAGSPDRESVFRAQFEGGFDLAAGRLCRALLVHEPDGEQWLLVTIHHIACDGWSATVLEQEFQQLRAQLEEGLEPNLPAPAVQYADYAAWQTGRRNAERLAADLAYWRETLADATPLDLPADRVRPAERDGRGDLVPFTIPADQAERLAAFAQRSGATPFMAMLTVFCTLLSRLSGQWNVPVGVPVAGRDHPDLERVVGFFLNSLVLHCRLDAGLAFDDALRQVRDTAIEAFAHQDVPFDVLVEELAPERDPARTPLYQAALNFNEATVSGGMPDRAHDAYLYSRQAAKTDLTLYVRTEPDGRWTGAFEYATSLFDRDTIERVATALEQLVASFTADAATTLGAARIITPEHREEVRTRWNATARPWERVPLIDLIERQAAATPDALAVIADKRRLTFRELDEEANQIAHQLAVLGAAPDVPVGILLNRGPKLLPALLGVWKAGAPYLPLDPANPPERIARILADSAAGLLITETALAPLAAEHQGTRVLVDGRGIESRPRTALPRSTSPDQLAYVIYTSGSTGTPKGVMVTHAGLSNHIQWAARELADGDGGAPLFSSFCFDLPLPNLYAPLLAGAPVHLLPADLELNDLGRVLTASAPFSFIKLATGHLELLGGQLSDEQIAGLAGRIVVAGEALPAKLANRWSGALGPGRLINEYGPTENSVGSSIYPVTREYDSTVPIGLPLPNTAMHVLDPRGQLVPVGAPGEVCVSGAGVARGYLGRPDLTAARFLPDPFGPPGTRLYRTGDLGRRLPDGAIQFLGRIDGQVKIRGYRVEVGEIQAQLCAHPSVRDAAVIALDTPTGLALAAYLVPAGEGEAPDPGELRTYLAGRLPEYMVPRVFVELERIPLTGNGKLDTRALPAPKAAERRFVAPETETENVIAQIWAELFGVEQLSVEESFFELGGHSILAIEMTSQIQDAFDIDVPLRLAFEYVTVRGLAGAVDELLDGDYDADSEALTGGYAL